MTSTRRVETQIAGKRAVASIAGDAEPAVVCLHGLAAQRGALTPLVETLAEHGFTAIAPDLRGHGESQGPRGRLSRTRTLGDIAAWRNWLDNHDREHVATIGHSVGGWWTLAAANENIAGEAIAIVATPASLLGQTSPIERLAYQAGAHAQRLVGHVGLDLYAPYPVPTDEVFESPSVIEQAESEGWIQSSQPLANAEDLLSIDAPSWARTVDVPALVAHPTRDGLIPEHSTRRIFDALPDEATKTWTPLDGPHSCFVDGDGSANAAILANWLNQTLA